MNQSTQNQIVQRLMAGQVGPAELQQIDARHFDGWRRLVVSWVKNGGRPAIVQASLDAEQRRELARAADLHDQAIQDHLITWADLGRELGPQTWSWPQWLPNGYLVLVAAAPGVGKSALCLRLAASVIRSDPWPDGQPYVWSTGVVLWGEAEAAQGINLERARQWRIPLDRLVTPLANPLDDLQLDDPEHLHRVATIAERREIKLIIIDSLRGANSGDENSSESIGIVKALAVIARDCGKPVILTHHLRKRGALDTREGIDLDRVRGSSAIVQPARVVWGIDVSAGGSDVRRLAVIKNNLGTTPEPIGFVIGDDGVTFTAIPEQGSAISQHERAAALLPGLLAGGRRPSEQVLRELEAMGVSRDAAKRAKRGLGIRSEKEGNRWYWAMDPERIGVRDGEHVVDASQLEAAVVR